MGGPLRAGDIFRNATEQQIEEYLLPVARGERCCFSLTEADAGSDVRAMRTTAVRDGAGYRLTGHKVFSTAGPFADFAIVIARMDGTEDSCSAFFVDLDTPGCRVEDGATPMSGEHIEADVIMDDCRVPATALIGQEGEVRPGIVPPGPPADPARSSSSRHTAAATTTGFSQVRTIPVMDARGRPLRFR